MKRSITKEELAKVKELDLLTYLQNYEPDELVRNSRSEYRTREHGSLVISNGLWHWIRGGVGGKSALDYFILVKKMEFLDAALYLKSCLKNKTPVKIMQQDKSNYEFRLPKPSGDNTKIINYLCVDRCIDREIVDYCIQHYYIYQQALTNAVVFVGYDADSKARFASTRSTTGTDKRDIAGSDKRYSFSLSFTAEKDSMHVFESAIDLLSFLTLLKLHGRSWKNGNYLSLGGVMRRDKPAKELVLPRALKHYLSQHPNIKTIYMRLDNDKAGHDTLKEVRSILQGEYMIMDRIPKNNKDINDQLKKYCTFIKQKAIKEILL